MEREGFDLPLLIGGATTSRVHTAVKISPNYHRCQAIYVTDASRAVGVVSGLMSPEERPKAIARVREEYRNMAESYARGQAEKARTSIADARKNKLKLDWANYAPPKPTFLGTRASKAYDLAELARFIDWTPFFHAWELNGP
jgi:5-methyltetrahydrofolate--homocysteine methyltransferase